jgi:hypothetical protein
MDDGKLRVLQWKENTGDDNEQILGVIHLRGGHDFLVSASSNPEGNEYRVYGYRKGKLVMVFQGGGGVLRRSEFVLGRIDIYTLQRGF